MKQRIDTTLELEEYVVKSQSKGGREKIIYTIINMGIKVLKEWVKDKLRYKTLRKLF